MDLFRKQEAAERQLMEWKQVPERKIEGFFLGGIGGVAFWYIFLFKGITGPSRFCLVSAQKGS